MPEVYQGASPNARLLAGSSRNRPEQLEARLATRSACRSCRTSILAALGPLRLHAPGGAVARQSTEPAPSKTSSGSPQPGPGGGGGGGGNKTPEPPRKAELPDKAEDHCSGREDAEARGAGAAQAGAADHYSGPARRVWRRTAAGCYHPDDHADDFAGQRDRRRRGNGTGQGSRPGRWFGPRPRLRRRLRRRRLPARQRRHAAKAASARSSPTTPPRPCAPRFRASSGSKPSSCENGSVGQVRVIAIARSDLRPRSGGRTHRQEVGLRPRHPTRPACPGADRDRDVLHASLALR